MAITSGDLDGDGYLDLAVANTGSNTVSILFNNGNGTFQPAVDYGTGNEPYSVCAADIDGDGDTDLITANSASNNVSVLFNSGDGTIEQTAQYSTGGRPFSVIAADLDGDGASDLVTANNDSSTVSVLMNNGDGMFNPKVDYDVADGPYCVVTGNLDGDAFIDLAVATTQGLDHAASVLTGNGDGTFQPAVYAAALCSPTSITSSDLDGDGDFDLANVNYNPKYTDENYVSVFLNNGDATFTPAYNYGLTGMESWWGCLSDLDGDGDEDMAVVSVKSGYVLVMFNTTVP